MAAGRSAGAGFHAKHSLTKQHRARHVLHVLHTGSMHACVQSSCGSLICAWHISAVVEIICGADESSSISSGRVSIISDSEGAKAHSPGNYWESG